MKANPLYAPVQVPSFFHTTVECAVASAPRRLLLAAFTFTVFSACLCARGQAVVTDCSESGLLHALSVGGPVTFSGNCTITLSQPIDITGPTTIDGGIYAVTLSGAGSVPLFNVSDSLTLKNLTIAGGLGALGGAMYISPGALVLVTNCIFAGNVALGTNGTPGVNGADSAFAVGGNGTAGTSGTAAMGGAIFNSGTLTLWNSTFITNNATAGNGAVGGKGGASGGSLGQGGNGGNGGSGAQALGGAVYNGGSLTTVNCTFTGNSVAGGEGAAGGAGGSALFPGLAGNGGAGGLGSGAGIYNASNIVVWGCTFSGNTAAGGNSSPAGTKSNGAGNNGPNGADAQGAGLTSAFSCLITNCTFFDNLVIGGNGGDGGPAVGSASVSGNGGNGGNGVGASACNVAGTFTNVNCTLAGGSAVGGTNGVRGSGPFPGHDGQLGQTLGGGLANGGTFLLMNSLLSTNTPGGNGSGSFVDGGHNLSSDASIALGATSLLNTDPKLGALANNGGPTLTMALLTNSPAIDAVGTNAGTFPATDQRGVQRPLGKGADIGAFELATSPGIITQPQSQAQSLGASVTFTVDAAGASLRYQWQFGSSNIPTATASSYTLSNVNITNAGNYRVVITNSFGSITSAVASLTIVPYILSAPTNQEVTVNGSASFSVSASGSSPLSYQWYFNSTNGLTGASATNFSVPKAQLSDAGAYSVVVSNPGGSITSAPATLLVDSILVPPASQTVQVGDTVTLSVVASGTSLQYQWYENVTNLIPGVIQPTYSFIATTNRAGLYNVQVYNTLLHMVSLPALVKVVAPTSITASSVTSNRFNLAYPTQPNVSYVLQSKNSLLAPNWTPLQTNAGTGSWLTNSDWATNHPGRFYRLLIQ
jgi:hypothetical protein